jgi:hypothetical protein
VILVGRFSATRVETWKEQFDEHNFEAAGAILDRESYVPLILSASSSSMRASFG